MTIQLLSPEVVAKIAAGEVVERPSSAVKELIENSLDAGARSIQIEIVAGGCDLIRVSDDGAGIDRDDLKSALLRHATSKIQGIEDLGRVRSLGFRGEALASIAAVSDLSLVSRPRGGSAHRIAVSEGREEGISGASRSHGTTVTVERLFFNLPARRKFLRSAASESNQVAQVVSQFALSYPEVAFELISDARALIRTEGRGDSISGILGVLGQEVAAALLPVEAIVHSDQDTTLPAAVVRGHVANPSVSRASRSGIWLFVNRRPIRSRSLSHAVEEAYRTLLQVGRFPVAVIDLEVPPWEVDVNVHPAKAEVKLLRERLIYGGLRNAVRAAVTAGTQWARDIKPGVDDQELDSASPEPASPRLIDAPIAATSTPEEASAGRRLPILRLMGQVAQTYIVAEGEQGLYLIDQHAAHERVMLSQLLNSSRLEPNTQLLLEPVAIDLAPGQSSLSAPVWDALRSLGFELESFGERSLLVRGVPGGLPQDRAVEALRGALEDLAEEATATDWRERVAISLSCRSAVKAGQPLSLEEMRALVEALEEADINQHCSHGRPTAIVLSRTQLDREFGRR
jgi:DNA mismatch repair protein MutL